MKIRMVFTVTVDESAWMAEYHQARHEVPQDVRGYFEALLRGSYPVTEHLVTIEVKR